MLLETWTQLERPELDWSLYYSAPSDGGGLDMAKRLIRFRGDKNKILDSRFEMKEQRLEQNEQAEASYDYSANHRLWFTVASVSLWPCW